MSLQNLGKCTFVLPKLGRLHSDVRQVQTTYQMDNRQRQPSIRSSSLTLLIATSKDSALTLVGVTCVKFFFFFCFFSRYQNPSCCRFCVWCSLEYNPQAGPTKFMIGTEQGNIMACNRKAKNPQDRVGTSFPGEWGPWLGCATGQSLSVSGHLLDCAAE